jgi:hypothetical protein
MRPVSSIPLPRRSPSAGQCSETRPSGKGSNEPRKKPSFKSTTVRVSGQLERRTSAGRKTLKCDSCPLGAYRLVSRPLLGVTLRGQTCARRHGVVLLSRNLPEQVCKTRQRAPHKLLPGPTRNALLGAWEPGPLARLCHV